MTDTSTVTDPTVAPTPAPAAPTPADPPAPVPLTHVDLDGQTTNPDGTTSVTLTVAMPDGSTGQIVVPGTVTVAPPAAPAVDPSAVLVVAPDPVVLDELSSLIPGDRPPRITHP